MLCTVPDQQAAAARNARTALGAAFRFHSDIVVQEENEAVVFEGRERKERI
jgi:hypothetical protein